MIPLALPSLLYLSPTLISSKTAAAAAAASSSSSSETRQDKTRQDIRHPSAMKSLTRREKCLAGCVDSSRGRVDKLASGPKRKTRQPSPMAFNLAAACLSSQSYSSTSSSSSLDSSSTLFLDPFFSLKLFYCLAAAAAAAAVN